MKRFSPQVLFAIVIFAITNSASFAQPIAAFTANVTSGCAPLVVSFQNQSTQALSYEWQTGVSTSALANPTVLYTAPGSYTVTLIAIDGQGNRDTLIQDQFIKVYASPVADFGEDLTQVCAGGSVQFTDASTAGSGNIVAWNWDFGDGNNATVQAPSHTFTSGGVYPVSLQVENQFGCSHSILKPALIQVDQPDGSFTSGPRVACGAPLTVNFQALGGGGLTHEWWLGNGSSSTQPNPAATYQAIGSYDVTHIVTDNLGCKDTVVEQSFVNIGANTLAAFADDSTVCSGDDVLFTAQAPATSQVIWDFGNGDSASGITATYAFPQAGNFPVNVTISDPGGCQATRQIPMEVFQTPVADFTVADTTLGCEIPFTVQFVNQSTGATSYKWLFYGAGPHSSSTSPVKDYTAFGTWSVRLVATGANGCRDIEHRGNYIEIREPILGFGADKEAGCVPMTVQFEDTSETAYPIIDWEWDFGDGTSGSGQSPTHTYANPGVYTVTLVITNSQGCVDTVQQEDFIQVGTKPSANFVADTTQACALGEVNFTNLSTNANEFLWLFGDGDTAMSVHATHGFAALGPMDVTLVAINQGCADTLDRPLYIDVLAPLPVIGMSNRYICDLPETVDFLNLSIGADSWQWTLPDGSISTNSQVSHTFTQPGQFPISLLVENTSTGCIVEITDSLYAKPIIAQFAATPIAACHPLTVAFQDLSVGATKWVWNFGNGQTSPQKDPTYKFPGPGYYNVSLEVENDFGCTSIMTMDSIRSSNTRPRFEIIGPFQGCSPLTVTFRNQTVIQAAENLVWQWDFGDGGISSLENPSHTYSTPGTYDVTLTVTDDLGCTKSWTMENAVTTTAPVPAFDVSPKIICPDVPLTFVNNSTGLGLSYAWSFGNGDSSAMANPSYAFADTGSYDITLTITDIYGCTKTLSKPDLVAVHAFEAEFVEDTTFAACPPLPVTVSARNDMPHPGTFFQWNFGNGATADKPISTHTYTQPGVYDVTLIIGTPSGCRDTLRKDSLIRIEGPKAIFTYTPDQGCPGTQVDFSATSEDSVQYQWIYGDGSMGLGQSSSHIYHTPGKYVPVLIIEDSDGCTVFNYARDSIEIFTPPVADFSPVLEELCDSGQVQFQAMAQGNVTQWNWAFGNGMTSTLQNPQISFSQTGGFSAQLTVVDQNGCSDTVLQSSAIRIWPSPEPLISVTDSAGCSPLEVTLSGQPNTHVSPIASWEWSGGSQTGQGQHWTTSFSTPGTVLVALSVTDQKGCTGTSSQELTVYANPTADFAADQTETCAPDTIRFQDLSSNQIVAWRWSFGDGQGSSLDAPSHVYLQDGRYDVGLWVEDSNGCQDSLLRSDYLKFAHPVAEFAVSDVSACPGSQIWFTDQSQSQRPLTQWAWSFGDGQTGQGQQTGYRYPNSGSYSVSLMVTDSVGCSDSTTFPVNLIIEENVPAEPIQIIAASVLNDQEVRIDFEPYDNRRDDFGGYRIYRSLDGQAYSLVDSVNNMTQTTYVDGGLNTRWQRYWYKVEPHNHCGNGPDWEDLIPHATINLATSPGVDQAFLNWTAYEGWDEVDEYHVYRVTGYGATQQTWIGTVPGDETSFVDEGYRCDEQHFYRVMASRNQITASSDSAFSDPYHLGPQTPTHMVRATVENNRSILVEWEPALIDMADRVVIERSRGLNFETVGIQPVQSSGLKLTDADVDVSDNSYTYRVTTIDSCGDATPAGRIGKTVLVRAERNPGKTYLQWTPYEGWEQGVEGYTVEVFSEADQAFVTLAQLDGGATEFLDDKTDLPQSSYCYRITAWEYGGNESVSLSNEVCVEPEPFLFTPTAFSPNGDGINDVFQIQQQFVGEVSFTVFNRWGNKVFESSSLDLIWNGWTVDGMPAPEGVYVYSVQGTGFNGQTIQHSGSITLFR